MKIVTHNFPNASLGWDRQALDTPAFDVAAIVFSRSAQALQLGSYVDGSLRFLATKASRDWHRMKRIGTPGLSGPDQISPGKPGLFCEGKKAQKITPIVARMSGLSAGDYRHRRRQPCAACLASNATGPN